MLSMVSCPSSSGRECLVINVRMYGEEGGRKARKSEGIEDRVMRAERKPSSTKSFNYRRL